MHIIPLYAALLALMFIYLSIRTVRVRRALSIGDGGDERMLRAVRVHSNFSEYVPMALVVLYFAELQGASAILLHGLSLSLLAGRISHALALRPRKSTPRLRIGGMMLTFLTLLGASVYLLAAYAGVITADG